MNIQEVQLNQSLSFQETQLHFPSRAMRVCPLHPIIPTRVICSRLSVKHARQTPPPPPNATPFCKPQILSPSGNTTYQQSWLGNPETERAWGVRRRTVWQIFTAALNVSNSPRPKRGRFRSKFLL